MGNKYKRVAPTKDKPKKKKKVCTCLKCSVLTSVASWANCNSQNIRYNVICNVT